MSLSAKYYELNYRHFLPSDRSIKILDYGSGDRGVFVLWLKSIGYYNAAAFDPGYHGNGFSFLEGKQFDLIFSIQVIYFFKDIEKETKALVAALKHNGCLIVEVFNGAMPCSLNTKNNSIYMNYALNEHALEDLMTLSGLTTISISKEKLPITHPLTFLWLALRTVWFTIVRIIYFLERGLCHANPKIFSKNIIYCGTKECGTE